MKKIFKLLFVMLAANITLQAAELPDNIYFKAMKDEMARTLKYLHESGSPKINFVSYKIRKKVPLFSVESSLGSFYPAATQYPANLSLWTTVSVGDNQQDSLGMEKDSPINITEVADSYDGIRQALWQATSGAYFQAVDLYQQKQTYKQQKNIKDDLPDVVPSVQSNYTEEIGTSVPDFPTAHFQDVIQRLTAQGNQYPYILSFYISLFAYKDDVFYLNNNGGFYQTDNEMFKVRIRIEYITKEGFRKIVGSKFALPLAEDIWEEKLTKEADRLLAEVKDAYNAVEGKSYIGPVLLAPRATAQLLAEVFVPAVTNLTALHSLDGEDTSAGILQDSIRQQIVSPLVNIYDRPMIRTFDGFLTEGFTPVDDEGVQAQDLTIVQNGILTMLPHSTRPFAKGIKSNGHARGNPMKEPRESLTNLVMEVENGISEKELEDALLQRCRERGLEYCYIIPDLPESELLTRIYSKDGHKEKVYGLIAQNYDLRTLRKDVITGGVRKEMHHFSSTSIIAPSLLLDDMSLRVSKKRPDRPPFILKP